MGNEYTTLKLPTELVDEVDQLVGKHGFTSRAEVAKEAIRKLLQQYKEDQVVERKTK
jgi:Arc/MetJ-type ribon-helix-helix transcriptional regulator